MQSMELKVKRLTLIAEARIIRKLEKAQAAKLRRINQRPLSAAIAENGDLVIGRASIMPTLRMGSLLKHRRYVVRPAARAAHLAHAYLRGHPYAKVETLPKKPTYSARLDLAMLNAVAKNLQVFGGYRYERLRLVAALGNWVDGADPVAPGTENIEGGAPVGVRASNPDAEGSTPSAAAILTAKERREMAGLPPV